MASGATERLEERPRVMTHSMRERLSEKNGSRKTIFGVLSNKKYEVRRIQSSYSSHRKKSSRMQKKQKNSSVLLATHGTIYI